MSGAERLNPTVKGYKETKRRISGLVCSAGTLHPTLKVFLATRALGAFYQITQTQTVI
jgi:hypothetical protein